MGFALSHLRTAESAASALILVIARRVRHPGKSEFNLRFEWTVEFMRREWNSLANSPFHVMRKRSEVRDSACAAHDVQIIPERFGTCEAFWFVPQNAGTSASLIIYIHGGGFTLGSTRSHARVIMALARCTGVRILSVDYRLAPEHPFPAAVDDIDMTLQALLRRGVRASQIVLAGSSSGGNLALVCLLRLRDRGLPLPAAAVLMSPWLDLDYDSLRNSMSARDYQCVALLKRQSEAYRAGIAAQNPMVSPVHADLRGLPPLLVQAGEDELFAGSCEAFIARCRRSGVNVRFLIHPHMPHAPEFFYDVASDCYRAIAEPAAFIKQLFTLTESSDMTSSEM